MKTRVIRWAIVLVVLAQIGWMLLEPRNFSFPRSPEAAQAIHVYQTSPSPATKAAMLDQIHRNVLHNERRGLILPGLLLFADAIAIYFLWNCGAKKSQPNTALEPTPTAP
jgi:hypothetical protein